MKKIILIIALTLNLNSETMENIYLKNACSGCHGMYGEGIGASPRLTGVKEAILYRRLKNLQRGKTRSAFGSIMVSFAKILNEEETKEMAKYLSNLKEDVTAEKYDIEYEPSGDGGS